MKKIVFLLVTAFTLTLTSQESVLLRYNFKKGDVYEVKLKMNQEVGTFMAQTTNLVMTQTTTSVSNNIFTNEGKIEKMTMDMLQGGNTLFYDSTQKEEELDTTGKMMKQQMDPILSSVLTTKSDNLGNVLGITVAPNNPKTAQMTKQNSSVVYPERAVKVGSEWSSTNEDAGLTVKMTYKVVSISDDKVELSLIGEVSGMATGTAKGNLTLDRASGMPSVSKVEMKMDAQGQKMNILTETTYTKL